MDTDAHGFPLRLERGEELKVRCRICLTTGFHFLVFPSTFRFLFQLSTFSVSAFSHFRFQKVDTAGFTPHTSWPKQTIRKPPTAPPSTLKPSFGPPPTRCAGTWTPRNTSTSAWASSS